jgi:hypothetical protein
MQVSKAFLDTKHRWNFNSNIATGNPLQIEGFIGKSCINGVFSTATLEYRRIYPLV